MSERMSEDLVRFLMRNPKARGGFRVISKRRQSPAGESGHVFKMVVGREAVERRSRELEAERLARR